MLHKAMDLGDLYFDDEHWDVRYLVVHAHPGRRQLVSPIARGPSATGEASLRSSAEVIGCGIEATDGEVGSVADLLIDDETWEITDVLVDSRRWLPGKLLLISPQAIERIDWREKTLHLRLAREDILRAPEVRL
jgi:hypothetical protein